MNRIVAVIPARMGSSRFPGKPLAPLLGRPMIEHVFRRAAMCDLLDAVYVATCDDAIRASVEAFGGDVVMTSAGHERASDRVAEVAERIDADVLVMIQGDEPMITPGMIETAVIPMLEDHTVFCLNLIHRIRNAQEYLDLNTIKVVMDIQGNALYFSRAPIPAIDFTRGDSPAFKQVCVIPFRRDFLREYARLPPTPLELAESIDMLRVIEHGSRVRLVETEVDTHAVDTPEDLRLVETLMKDDPLIARYSELVAKGGNVYELASADQRALFSSSRRGISFEVGDWWRGTRVDACEGAVERGGTTPSGRDYRRRDLRRR
jgi:3-deoxy-manno-octulosonate cytidylyltransferase (CMP-KDO synthetase)